VAEAPEEFEERGVEDAVFEHGEEGKIFRQN
jgi:hypothetical protein